jgi:hypothetical protein
MVIEILPVLAVELARLIDSLIEGLFDIAPS